jgi:hypothetical protein
MAAGRKPALSSYFMINRDGGKGPSQEFESSPPSHRFRRKPQVAGLGFLFGRQRVSTRSQVANPRRGTQEELFQVPRSDHLSQGGNCARTGVVFRDLIGVFEGPKESDHVVDVAPGGEDLAVDFEHPCVDGESPAKQ